MNNAGRPKLNIDWDKVKEMIECGCSGQVVANCLGIHRDTLYDSVKDTFGIYYSDFSAIYKAKGDKDLLTHQHKKALGLVRKGSDNVLLHLAKHRLGQKDEINVNITEQDREAYKRSHESIEQLRQQHEQTQADA